MLDMKPEGLSNIDMLIQYILKRAYSKNNDIKILENNGYSEDCAQAYMDGYVDGLSHILSLLEPSRAYEDYFENIFKNDKIDISNIEIGNILLSKKANFPCNLSIVVTIGEDNRSNHKSLLTFPMIPANYIKILDWKPMSTHIIENSSLPKIYYEDGNNNFAINVSGIYSVSQIDNYVVIGKVDKKEVLDIINHYRDLDMYMSQQYDQATNKQ